MAIHVCSHCCIASIYARLFVTKVGCCFGRPLSLYTHSGSLGSGPCPDSRQCKKKVKVKCSCGHRTEEWGCEDVQCEKEKRGTLRLRKDIEAEAAKGKAKTRNENALLACTPECEELKKKREAERLEEERLKKEEQERMRKEREQQEGSKSGRARKDGAGQVKRTSRKWREEEEEVQERSYRWLLIVAAIVLLLGIIISVMIKTEWRGTRQCSPF